MATKTSTRTRDAIEVGRKIRLGIKRLKLKLGTLLGDYAGRSGYCCAVGGALAYGARSRAELIELSWGDPSVQAARIVGRNATPNDMRMLERGFEGWDVKAPEKSHAFYKLGQRLRKEAD